MKRKTTLTLDSRLVDDFRKTWPNGSLSNFIDGALQQHFAGNLGEFGTLKMIGIANHLERTHHLCVHMKAIIANIREHNIEVEEP